MLVELSIANFAIIDQLTLAPGSGFNVLTGETGAGKSIIIDAVGALLGGRVGPEVVRAGCEVAHVEGVFDLAAVRERSPLWCHLAPLLEEHGVDPEDTLILSRDLYRSGRTVARVGGRAVPVGVLRQIGEALVDVHGQSEHLSLLRPAEHVEFLDRYGGLMSLREQVAARVADLRRVQRERSALQRDERELARRTDLLRFQSEEIAAARLTPGEEEQLAAEERILANAEQLTHLSQAAYAALYEGEGRGGSALDSLGEAVRNLAELARLDPGQREPAELAENLTYQLEDLARSLRSYRDSVEYNPERLATIVERLDLLRGLKRKYGSTLAEVLAFQAEAQRELETISHSEERLADLARAEAELRPRIGALAGELTHRRREAAVQLSRALETELADLNMGRARFEVALTQAEDSEGVPVRMDGPSDSGATPRSYAFDATGVDRVEFQLSPNPGEPLKPLARIASGGETARLMLAMKAVLSRADTVPTLIFDEIDVGIGGRSGVVVGQKLWGLSLAHQVLCITHLPQTASFGETHFNIVKQVEGDRTVTRIRRLDDSSRAEELAQMLGGATTSTRHSAAEMLQQARQWAESSKVVRK